MPVPPPGKRKKKLSLDLFYSIYIYTLDNSSFVVRSSVLPSLAPSMNDRSAENYFGFYAVGFNELIAG